MCDYSLEVYRARPAREGELYVTQRFASGTVGLVSPGDSGTAVCVPADSRVRLIGIDEAMRRKLALGRCEEALFVRLHPSPHRDGIRFANGAETSLQSLAEGVWIALMALPGAGKPAAQLGSSSMSQ